MKGIRKLITGTAVAGFLGFAPLVNALSINGGLVVNTDNQDAPFNNITGGGAGNNETVIRGWLDGEILSYFNHNQIQLPAPTPFTEKWEGGGVPSSIDVLAGDYLVLHYGTGTGGVPGTGGGLLALYFAGNESFSVPANGPLGPNGLGGISTVWLFDHTGGGEPGPGVPDGGATLALLGAALTGLGFARRKLGA